MSGAICPTVSKMLKIKSQIPASPCRAQPPRLADIKALGVQTKQNLMLTLDGKNGACLWDVSCTIRDLESRLKGQGFGGKASVIFSFPRGDEKLPIMRVPTLPLPNEFFVCDSLGLNVGISSPLGLGLIRRGPSLLPSDSTPEEWQENRALFASFSLAGRPSQVLPYHKPMDTGISCLHSTAATYLATRSGSFQVSAHEIKWAGQRKQNCQNSLLTGLFFTWEDLASLSEKIARNQGDIPMDLNEPLKMWTELFPSPMDIPSRPASTRDHPHIFPDMENHNAIYLFLDSIRSCCYKNGERTLVLNYDAHADLGYDPVDHMHEGNWAYWTQMHGLARVIHIPSRYIDDGASRGVRVSNANWNTPVRRASISEEVRSVLMSENVGEIVLTIDFDAFSLRQPYGDDDYYGRWPVYHMPLPEVRKDLSALRSFLIENGIKVDQIMPCSSPDYLNVPEMENPGGYIEGVNGVIRDVFDVDSL